LLAHKVGILPDIGHSCQDFSKPAPLRSAQRCLKDLAMRFLSAATLGGRPLLQGLHDVLVKIPHH
jgi:hypothetical protein